MRSSLLACALLLGGLALACSGGVATEGTRTALPTATAAAHGTPSVTAAPVTFFEPTGLATARRGDRTGLGAVDSVIAEIEARDVEALAARLRFVELKCVAHPELGDPPACADGEPVGTTVPVFRHGLGCHGGFRRDATAAVEELLADELSLHSVVRVEPHEGEPRYELLFVATRDIEVSGRVVLSFHLEGSQIATVTDGCGIAPDGFRAHRYLEAEAAEVILRGPAFPPDFD